PLISLLLSLLPPPSSTLFPYTTLFRSPTVLQCGQERHGVWLDPADDDISRWTQDHDLLGGPCGDLVRSMAGLMRLLDARHRIGRSEEHTSELQSHLNLVCRLLLEKKKK